MIPLGIVSPSGGSGPSGGPVMSQINHTVLEGPPSRGWFSIGSGSLTVLV